MPEADREITLKELQRRVSEFTRLRRWQVRHSPGELSKAIVVEAAELLELSLWSPDGSLKGSEEELRSEMADILIYLLNLAELTGTDLGQSVVDKLRINESRFPL